MGGEQPVAAEADPLDQPADEDVGAHLAHRPGGGPVQPEELADPVARLGRDLRALQRGLERRDHVELAAARDRGAARQVDRAQLHRRAAQRPDGRGRVGRVGEQPQPGDHVAHLGPQEERAGPGQPVRDPPLLERRGDRPRAPAAARHRDADPLHLRLARRQRRLDVARHRLRLGALVDAAPEAHPGRRSGRPPGDLRLHAPRSARRRRGRRRAGRRRSARQARARSARRPSASRAQADAARQGARACSSSQESTALSAPRASASISERSAGQASSSSSTSRSGKRAAIASRQRRALAEQPGQQQHCRRRRPSRRPPAASSRGARRSRRTRARGPPSRARIVSPPACSSAQSWKRSAVTPADLSASIRSTIRASSPAGLPRISWRRSGSSSIRSSSIASRSAALSDSKNGSIPASVGVLAQQPRGGHRVGVDDQLLVAGLDQRLGPLPDPVRRRGGPGRGPAACAVGDQARSRRASASVRPVPATPSTSRAPRSWSTTACCSRPG